MLSSSQSWTLIGLLATVPVGLVGFFWTATRAGFADLRSVMDARFDAVDTRFEAVDRRFEGMDRRFDDVDRRFDRLDGDVQALTNRVFREP